MNPEELRLSAANFPDANFRSVVANAFDTDQSGWLTDAEIAAVDSFDTEDTDYTTVQGMEFFTEMTFLMLDGAPSLTSIDLTANTKLRYVDVCYNGLTEVNIEGLYDLIDLDDSQNALSTFDVSDFDLEHLACYTNPMTSLTLGNQSGLRYLSCYGTDLVTLDLRGCPLLLDCLYNGTKTAAANYVEYKVDNTRLLRVDAGTELIIPGMVRIDEEHFPDTAFRAYVSETFDTNNSGWLSAEEIMALDEDDNPKSVDMYDAGVTSLEGIQYLTELRVVNVSGSPSLTAVDLSGNTKLRSISFYQTGITGLNVSGLALTHLSCDDAPLTALTLGSDIRWLYRTDLQQ
jgi:Leucine-rich repeat (LRR) protein